MAFWQYSFHAIPVNGLIKKYIDIPNQIIEEDFNDFNWFDDFEETKFIQSIHYLPSNTHWCQSTCFFGTYESDSIEIGFEGNLVSYISLRLDLREHYPSTLDKMLQSLRLSQLMVIDEEMTILNPSYDDVMKKISVAVNYKNNFFKSITQK